MKISALLLFVICTNFGLHAQNVSIPDANFKAYLLGEASINTNGDAEIQMSEASAFTTTINCPNLNITDLTGIEAFVNLMQLSCYDNQLTSLNLSSNGALSLLDITGNLLDNLDVSANTDLSYLYCSNNQLTSINISANTDLEELSCNNNQLTILDVSSNTALNKLLCGDNALTVLDLSSNVALEQVWCFKNQLNSLDVSSNVLLEQLFCFENQMTTLDLSGSNQLMDLRCYDNQITNLDLSASIGLNRIFCHTNELVSLDVSNGNNINMLSFKAYSNPNLNCITVDDPSWSTMNWTVANSGIDSVASFDTDCLVLVNTLTIQGQGGVSTVTTQGGTLQMEAVVLPLNADNTTYTWSLINGTGTAAIDASGLLTALTDGVVTVTATANDLSGVSGSIDITISNQSLGIDNHEGASIVVYPNPVNHTLYINSDINFLSIQLKDIRGKQLLETTENFIDVSAFQPGIYFLQVLGDNVRYVQKVKINLE